jgi:hypothetical protein
MTVPKTALFRALIFGKFEKNEIPRRWLRATDTLYSSVHLNQKTYIEQNITGQLLYRRLQNKNLKEKKNAPNNF